jgi:hypothetical protein
LLNEDPTSFRDPSGCNYNYIYGTSIHSWTTITGANADVIEQLYEVYTWKENSANPTTDFISAGRTLTGSLVETAW